MKKIFLLFLLIFAVGCENPFDKYKDSVDDVQAILEANLAAAGRVEDNLTVISGIVGGVTDWENLNDGDIGTLSSNFSSIANEITSGNMDVLLANIQQYGTETSELVDNIETYQTQLDDAILALPDGAKKDALNTIKSSVTSVVNYLNLKGVL